MLLEFLIDRTDIDFQQRVARTKPEKGSLPRMLPLSLKAIDMLNNIPKNSDRTFLFADDMRSVFYVQRKRIAKKLATPRLLQSAFAPSDIGKGQWNTIRQRTSSI